MIVIILSVKKEQYCRVVIFQSFNNFQYWRKITMNPTNTPYREPIYSRMIQQDELEREKVHHMNSSYSTHFQTFRSLPKLHSTAAAVIQCMETEHLLTVEAAADHLKETIDNAEKLLIECTRQYKEVVDYILKKITLMDDCPFLDIYAIKVLVAQLLWGTQSIPLGTIESTNLLYYETDMKEAFLEADIACHKTYFSTLPIYVRVNTLSISLEQCINAFCKEGWTLLQCPKSYPDYLDIVSQLEGKVFVRDIHVSELLVFPPCTNFYDHPGYLKGKFVLQDKGSCLASFLLNPKPGSSVLDMCAAPGNATNHLANIINNEGIVYAVDNHPHRYNKLYSFLELTNSSCVKTILSDNMKVRIDNLNYVLIDATSTYTGIFYKRPRPGLRRRLKQYFHASYKTLAYALQNFTTVKRIVYSSCTSFPEEGEKVIQYALSRVGDSYNLLDVKELLWNEWFSVGQTETRFGHFPFASKCLRTQPDFDKCLGYFIAVFERNFDVPVPPYISNMNAPQDSKEINEDETDDETSNDQSKKQKPALQSFERKRKFSIKLKKHRPKRKKNKAPACVQSSQTSTAVVQMQNNYPGSRPFYEINHSQLYP